MPEYGGAVPTCFFSWEWDGEGCGAGEDLSFLGLVLLGAGVVAFAGDVCCHCLYRALDCSVPISVEIASERSTKVFLIGDAPD